MRVLNRCGMDLRFLRLADLMARYHPPGGTRRARLWEALWGVVLGLALKG